MADTIPHPQKGEMIDRQLDRLQDPNRDVITIEEWRMMPDHMGGVDVMGGPATGLLVNDSPPPARSAPADTTRHEGH
jgi:hypothetical protein